jgi:hypothetical protein
MKTFVLKYRDFRHGIDGVTLVIVNAEDLDAAMRLAEMSNADFLDGETFPLLDHEWYGDNTVVAQVQMTGDPDEDN